jgi:hypothetical protein
MADFKIDDTYVETNSDCKRGCGLSNYNGIISIADCNEGKDGKKYMAWVYPQVKKDTPGKNVIPNQVRLGDIDQAKTILNRYLSFLNGDHAGENKDDDIPF